PKATKGSSDGLSDGCEKIEGRLRPLVTGNILARISDLGWTLPKSCYEEGHVPDPVQRKGNEGVAFVIATVPNPISTHLPLSFDRSLEIIQQAAQDNRYQYESSWLPW